MNGPALSYFAGWTDKQYQDLATRLARHAAKWLGQYGLTSGQRKIPGSKTIEDIVTDAINDIMTGRRPWNPQRHSDMEAFIKMVVVSEIRNLYKGKERLLVVPLLQGGEAADTELQNGKAGQGISEENLVSDSPKPDQILEEHERRAQITKLMRGIRMEIEASVRKQEVRDDIEYILMALEGENYTPEEIEKATGIPRQRVYKLLERIRTLAPRALNQLDIGTKGEAP